MQTNRTQCGVNVTSNLNIDTDPDPLTTIKQRMAKMSHEELQALVLIAANRVGLVLSNTNDHPTVDQAIIGLLTGLHEVFNAYDNAMFNAHAEIKGVASC